MCVPSVAVCENKPDHVDYLLQHGADPNLNCWGARYTALEVDAQCASTPVLERLLSHEAMLEHRSALNNAAFYGRLENVRCLLDHGAAIDACPDKDEVTEHDRAYYGVGTALHDAAKAGQIKAVKLLRSRGADPSIKDSLGRTAREVAAEKGHDECARLLE